MKALEIKEMFKSRKVRIAVAIIVLFFLWFLLKPARSPPTPALKMYLPSGALSRNGLVRCTRKSYLINPADAPSAEWI